MKIFLMGRTDTHAGPSNVNKALIRSADNDLLYIKSKNKIGMLAEIFFKSLRADIIVDSAIYNKAPFYVVKSMKKKLIAIIHGHVAYEAIINKFNVPKSYIEGEKLFLDRAELLLPVSEKYAEWFKNYCPQYAYKTRFLNNGVNIKRRKKTEKKPFSVAVGGGNRCIKNNIEVSRAVEKLIERGIPCKLYVFGRKYENNDDIFDFPFVKYMGQLEKDEYYEALDKISLFVMNSELESFGLVFADAVNCNCSLLFSEKVGATSLVETHEEDIVHNPHDIDELSGKVENALHNPNAERIFDSIDIDAASEKTAYQNLKKICEEVLLRYGNRNR